MSPVARPELDVKSGYSVSVIALGPLVELVRDAALEVAVLHRAGIAAEAMADPTHRLTEECARRLWRVAEDALGDPDIGLLAAERATVSSLDVFGFLWRASATVEQALSQVGRHLRTLCDHMGLEVELAERRARLVFTYGVPGRRSQHDYAVALAARFSRLVGAGREPGARVYFAHPSPASVATYARVFGVPVQFAAGRTYIEVDRTYLARRLPGHDATLSAILERQAEHYASGSRRDGGLEDQVRRSISASLAAGDPSLTGIARRLAMSPRTLSRKLQVLGTSHQRILDELRHGLAVHYLREERRPVGEVSHLLGFSHPSALHKALRRWRRGCPRAL